MFVMRYVCSLICNQRIVIGCVDVLEQLSKTVFPHISLMIAGEMYSRFFNHGPSGAHQEVIQQICNLLTSYIFIKVTNYIYAGPMVIQIALLPNAQFLLYIFWLSSSTAVQAI